MSGSLYIEKVLHRTSVWPIPQWSSLPFDQVLPALPINNGNRWGGGGVAGGGERERDGGRGLCLVVIRVNKRAKERKGLWGIVFFMFSFRKVQVSLPFITSLFPLAVISPGGILSRRLVRHCEVNQTFTSPLLFSLVHLGFRTRLNHV